MCHQVIFKSCAPQLTFMESLPEVTSHTGRLWISQQLIILRKLPSIKISNKDQLVYRGNLFRFRQKSHYSHYITSVCGFCLYRLWQTEFHPQINIQVETWSWKQRDWENRPPVRVREKTPSQQIIQIVVKYWGTFVAIADKVCLYFLWGSVLLNKKETLKWNSRWAGGKLWIGECLSTLNDPENVMHPRKHEDRVHRGRGPTAHALSSRLSPKAAAPTS